MAIGIILGIIFFAVVIGCIVGAYKCYDNDLNTGKVICIVLRFYTQLYRCAFLFPYG